MLIAEIICPDPPMLDNTAMTDDIQHSVDTKLTYQCIDDYTETNGPVYIVCQRNESWSTPLSECGKVGELSFDWYSHNQHICIFMALLLFHMVLDDLSMFSILRFSLFLK